MPNLPAPQSLSRLGGQLGVLLSLSGFLVMFFGWNGAASSNFVPAQFPFLISGGMVGLGIVVLGASLILVQNQRADMARLEAAVERVALAVERQGAGESGGASGLAGFVLAGSSSYHLPDCTLPEARAEAHLVPLADVRGSDLEACRVCRPPQFGRLVNGAPTPTSTDR